MDSLEFSGTPKRNWAALFEVETWARG